MKRTRMHRYEVEVTVRDPEDMMPQPTLFLQVMGRTAKDARREASSIAREQLSEEAVRLGFSLQVTGRLEVDP